jgi:hypothetical protein
MKKVTIVFTLILAITVLTACTGNQVTLPDSEGGSNTDKPYFVMFGGETENVEDYTYETEFKVANVHSEASWDGDVNLRYSVSLATQNPNPRFQEVEVGTGVAYADNNTIEVDIQDMVDQSDLLDSLQDVCGNTVNIDAELNPDTPKNPNHVEEADNLGTRVDLPDTWAKEHSTEILVTCDDRGQPQGISPIGQTDISDLKVNKDGLPNASPDRYVYPKDVNIADIMKTDQGWHVLFRGLANAPNFDNYKGVWKGKLSTFSSRALEETVGENYLTQFPSELGPKGILTSITKQPNGPGFLGTRHTRAYELVGLEEGNIENNGAVGLDNVGRLYDAAYQFPDGTPFSEEVIFADRGVDGDSAYLTVVSGSNYTSENRVQLPQNGIQGSIISVETYTTDEDERFYFVGSWKEPALYVYNETFGFEGKAYLGGEVNSTGTTAIDDDTLRVVPFKSWRDAPMETYDVQDILSEVQAGAEGDGLTS